MRIGTEEVGPSQGCRFGLGLRRVSLWADESGVFSLRSTVRRQAEVNALEVPRRRRRGC